MKKPPVDHDTPPLRPHVYDGIQEYDNRLPNWWLWTFYLAVIFTVVYWFSRYDADISETDFEHIDAAMMVIEEKRLASIGELTEETLWQMAENPGYVAQGASIYEATCAACHAGDLTGGIGLSLVDAEWKWGNNPLSVYEVIFNGSPEKTAGMQAWGAQLGPQGVSQVAAYVLSHHSPEGMDAAATLNAPIGL